MYVDGHVLILQMAMGKEKRRERRKEKVSLKVAHVLERDSERCILCVCM